MTSSNLVGCWTGRSAGLGALQDLVHVDGAAAIVIGTVRRVAHQTAGLHVFSRRKHRRQFVRQREFRERLCPGDEQRRRKDQNRVGTALDDRRKGAVKLRRAAYRHRLNLKPQCRARGFDGLQGSVHAKAWRGRR